MVNDPVYIKQIIGFVQCLMIAECKCTFVYVNYSKMTKVHSDSRKRLAYIFLFHNSVEASVYIRGTFHSVTLYVLFGSQYT